MQQTDLTEDRSKLFVPQKERAVLQLLLKVCTTPLRKRISEPVTGVALNQKPVDLLEGKFVSLKGTAVPGKKPIVIKEGN
ncbi:MAG: hypothetical protein WKF59_03680 [Chitinophagaceae bacterium]